MSEENIVRDSRDQYTKDTRTVAIFLREKGRSLGCPPTWLLRPKDTSKDADFVLYLPNCALIANYLSKKSNFPVSRSFLDTLKRAIELRIESKRVYQRRNKADKEHNYAIEKLQEVQKFLEGKLKTTPIGRSSEQEGGVAGSLKVSDQR